jgi:hypothetical protein
MPALLRTTRQEIPYFRIGDLELNQCKYCSREIHWINVQGKLKPFDDSCGSQIHTCQGFLESRKSLEQRVFELEEKLQVTYDLVSKLIPRLQSLEKVTMG